MNEIDIKNIKNAQLGQSARIKSGYSNLYYNSNPGNCKLCTLDYIGPWLNNALIEHVKSVLKLSGKLAFNVSVNYESQITFLETHFKLISVTKIPIGYGNGYQHHCCFLTGNENYGGYAGYLRRINSEKPKDYIPVGNVDDIFSHLKQITEEDLTKIKAYKQPKRAKDLIKKILEKK